MHADTHRDLRIPHRALERLLRALTLPLREERLLALALLREDLRGVLVLRVVLLRLLHGFERLRVVAHRVQHARLADVGLDWERVSVTNH